MNTPQQSGHPKWATVFARWIGGVAFVILALVQLMTAMGKLGDATPDSFVDNLKTAMYQAGLIQFTPYGPVQSQSPQYVDGGKGNAPATAFLDIGDNLLFRNVHNQILSQSCSNPLTAPVDQYVPTQHTTHISSSAFAGSCATGNSHLQWVIAADVVDRHDAIRLTKLGVAVFWVFISIGLSLTIIPSVLAVFHRRHAPPR